MIALLQRKGLKLFHPILKLLAKIYLSKPRNFSLQNISVRVFPGVFHPGLFFSTKVFIEYLESIELRNKRILELGAGSALISIYCARKGGVVTASDVNPKVIAAIDSNATKNGVFLKAVLSDLFDKLEVADFDLIIINPPYYPKQAKTMDERAWFCGEDFEYFQKLFRQLGESKWKDTMVLMILSEDCQLHEIRRIAKENYLKDTLVFSKTVSGEENYIFKIEHT